MTSMPLTGLKRVGVSELEPRAARVRPALRLAERVPGRAYRIDDLPADLRSKGPNKLDAEKCCRLCLRERLVRPLFEHELVALGDMAPRKLTRHHLVPKWYAADEKARGRMEDSRIIGCAANIVPICRPCHDLVETDEGYRRMLRRVLTPDEKRFVVAVCGVKWFEATYPS